MTRTPQALEEINQEMAIVEAQIKKGGIDPVQRLALYAQRYRLRKSLAKTTGLPMLTSTRKPVAPGLVSNQRAAYWDKETCTCLRCGQLVRRYVDEVWCIHCGALDYLDGVPAKGEACRRKEPTIW